MCHVNHIQIRMSFTGLIFPFSTPDLDMCSYELICFRGLLRTMTAMQTSVSDIDKKAATICKPPIALSQAIQEDSAIETQVGLKQTLPPTKLKHRTLRGTGIRCRLPSALR